MIARRLPHTELQSQAAQPQVTTRSTAAVLDEDGVAGIRDTAQVDGVVVRGEDRKAGVLALDIYRSEIPDTSQEPNDSVWAGVSGAAVVCGDCVVGVVCAHPKSKGPLTLEGVPIHRVLGDPGFCEALTGNSRPLRWDDPWSVLDSPYREMSPTDANSYTNLLRTEFGVVPFQGREEEMRELRVWLALEQPFAGWVLHGPSGAGKTRLAAHFADAIGREGWLTGFLRLAPGESFDDRRLEPLLASGLRLLIVVDEAHTWPPDDLANLLETLGKRRDARTRVLLLARGKGDQEGEWYDELRMRAARRLRNVDLGPEGMYVRALPPVDVKRRAAAFGEAAAAFAAARQWPARTLRVPNLSDSAFGQILPVHLLALRAALTDEDDYDDASPLDAALDWLLLRERDYWREMASLRFSGVSEGDHKRFVGLAVLVGASKASEDEAYRILEILLSDLNDQRNEMLADYDKWLKSLYPGFGRWPPLQPDLVADHLIAQLVDDNKRADRNKPRKDLIDVLQELPRLADGAQLQSAIDVLARVAGTHKEQGETAALKAFAAGPDIILPLAIAAAGRRGDPFGLLINRYLHEHPDGSLAAQLVAKLPEETVTLREAAVTIDRQARDHLRQREPSAGRDAEIARLDNGVARWLISLGRADEALAYVEEAVAIRRRLAEGEHAQDQERDFLAMSLSNQANCLTDLGRPNDALAAIQEAVVIRRELADTSKPEQAATFEPGLAASLSTMCGCLDNLRHYEEGLAAVEEAVIIYRRLAAARPDKFEPELARELTRQSIPLRELGRREDALAAIEEAVTINGRLAEARPDVFLENFAISLNNQSACLGELGRMDEALAAVEESVRIRRRLAAARPDAFLPGLAIALINLSEALAAVTPPRREEALKAIEESVSIHRRLFNVSPETYQIFLVESLSTQSNRLSELGRLEDAHEVITEAIELALPIYRKNPHRLRDPDQRLLQPYLDLCECLQWPPDPKIVAPMNAALAATNSFRNEE
jgi:tetratricopeptide (TPR) repeat protein